MDDSLGKSMSIEFSGSSPTADVGDKMYALIKRLYPICRSITGDGIRQTLAELKTLIDLQINEVPTGTRVFDWTVPKEWNVRDAYVADESGSRLVDFRQHNLHLLNYSIPIRQRMTFEELQPHLYSLPEHPDWIPYRTSYYSEDWGFCVTHHQLEDLEKRAQGRNQFEVVIDTTLEEGSLTFGELFIPGRDTEEVLISTHCCHPSLCNDNLSGIALASFLARWLAAVPRRLSYRFLFIPGTIGAITWLALNEKVTDRIRHGLVVTCVGDPGKFHYKRSRRGRAVIDRAAEHILSCSGHDFEVRDFSPYGYDERQYCSPGFDLPVGTLSRSRHGTFPQYHTSADDLDFVEARPLGESLALYQQIVEVLEGNDVLRNRNPKCEPQLGKRGLYAPVGGQPVAGEEKMAMLWLLNLSDGDHSILDIAERAGLPFSTCRRAADRLSEAGLLRPLSDEDDADV